jgi:hypothetical protein
MPVWMDILASNHGAMPLHEVPAVNNKVVRVFAVRPEIADILARFLILGGGESSRVGLIDLTRSPANDSVVGLHPLLLGFAETAPTHPDLAYII